MEYLGSLGRLVPLRCASTERVGATARYLPQTAIDGSRRAQVVPATPRTWDVSWGVETPADVAALSAFTSGAWGNGPWHWVSVRAQHGNVLTPREAMLLDFWPTGALTVGGPVHVNGVRAPRSLLHNRTSGWSPVFRDVPVVPGRPVTWAAEINSAGVFAPRLVLTLVDAAGATISNTYGTGAVTSAVQKVAVTVTPPANAVAFHASLDYTATRMIRPQVTWTAGPVEYSAGHGCRSAIVDGMSEDVILSTPSRTFSSVGFTVFELS